MTTPTIHPNPPSMEARDPGCPDFVTAGPISTFKPPHELLGFFQTGKTVLGAPKFSCPDWWKFAYSVMPSPIDGIVTAMVCGLIDAAGIMAVAIANAFGCKHPNMGGVSMLKSIYGVFNRWVGLSIPPVEHSLDQQLNYYCPQDLPVVTDANDLYRKGYISYDTWKCFVRSAGLDEKNAYPIMVKDRAQVDPRSLVQLYWKNELTVGELEQQLTGQGFFDPKDQAMLAASMEYVVPPQDLIRFMVRDVFNTEIVTSYNLAAEFTDVYQGEAKVWAAANGIDDDQMLKYWEAHWQVPSTGQLFEMYHRLRPDNPDVPPELAFGDAALAKALAVNDLSPQWRTRMAAISDSVITRVDAQRMYFAGVIDANRLNGIYRDNGYNSKDANDITKWQALQRKQWLFSKSADYSITTVCNLYSDSLISTADAVMRLTELGYDEETVTYSLSAANQRRDDKVRKETIAGIKRRYTRGGYDTGTAMMYLIKTGIDASQAEGLINRWNNLLLHQDKFPSIATLCGWFKDGIINIGEYQTRLQWLGYTYDDATKTVQACAIKAQGKPTKPKRLSVAQVCKAALAGEMTYDDALSYLGSLGYPHQEAEILLDQCQKTNTGTMPKPPKPPKPPPAPKPAKRPSDSDIEAAWQYGVLTWKQAMSELMDNGYTDQSAYEVLSAFAEKNGLAPGSDQPEPIPPVS